MRKIFFISDTHFNHANILKFEDKNGVRIRHPFSSMEDMNESMILNWNNTVSPEDHVYHLGDVAFGNVSWMENILKRLNGQKRLLLGNHDRFEMAIYRRYFQKIGSWRTFDKDVTGCDITFVACHYPLHRSAFSSRDMRFCLHGHVHQNSLSEKGYVNVSVEVIDYTPIEMSDVIKRMKAQL